MKHTMTIRTIGWNSNYTDFWISRCVVPPGRFFEDCRLLIYKGFKYWVVSNDEVKSSRFLKIGYNKGVQV